jgi:predicted dehydrogenase
VIEALQAGKHVFVEKPLAMTTGELTQVEQAYAKAAQSGQQLMVGFNRRFSPAATRVKDFFSQVSDPLTISIRFNAGHIPADHWTQDEKIGGGRIIGEACHAIDLATYFAGSPVIRVYAESIGGPHTPTISDDQCFITMRHANGSVSNVAYLAGGDARFGKERIEVLGGGQMAVIDDFTEVITSVGGKQQRTRSKQDKGHRQEIARFAEVISRGGEPLISWEAMKATSLAAILAVRSLREGEPIELPGYAAMRAAA